MDLLCALLSNRGRQILAERNVDERWVENYVYLFELLLQFEQFMKMRQIPRKYLVDERRLGCAMDHLMYILDNTIHREEGTMGNNLIKNHLLLHLPHYTSRWGPPTGMDSGDPERNHKTEVKPQAKWTQRREYSFQEQFGTRWSETRLVTIAVNEYRRVHGLFGAVINDDDDSNSSIHSQNCNGNAPINRIELDGSHFDIGVNDLGLPSMGWTDSAKRGRTTLPQPVVDFVCYSVLDKVQENSIHGRTEVNITLDGCREKFRCHPNYRSDSNQRIHMWYDWARFEYTSQSGKVSVLPGQIAAVIQVKKLKPATGRNSNKVRNTVLKSNTDYAVVRLFAQEPKFFRESTHKGMWYTYSVKWGKLRDGFFLLPLSTIVVTTIVVPNVEEDPEAKGRAVDPLDGGCFVFPSRDQLGDDFLGVIVREQADLDGLSSGSSSDSGNDSEGSAENEGHEEGSLDGESDEGGSTDSESDEEASTDGESDEEVEEETCRRINYLSRKMHKLDV